MASSNVIKAIAITAELCNTLFSEPAARMFAADLDGFSDDQIIGALARCRKELKGRLTVSEVVSRIDDGRPGVEQAWAMIPHDQEGSVVWTDEMSYAYGAARPLLEQGDRIGARLAFKDVYAKALILARDARRPPKWTASLGHDRSGHQSALEEAVRHGRLPLQYAVDLLPPDAAHGLAIMIAGNKPKKMLANESKKNEFLLSAPSDIGLAEVRKSLSLLNSKKLRISHDDAE